MKTVVLHPERDQNCIEKAAEILRRGGLVGIPTETVYGLGANGLDETAVAAIFAAKGRPQDNPLILHVPDETWLERCCRDVPAAAYELAARFWPGPLTMILPRRETVPLRTTGGLDTVGVRCPDHPLTRAIIRAADVPVAAPSGNTSGRPSPTAAAHMLEDMDGKIDAIVDGGNCAVGVESTIIDLTVTPPRLLRPGGVTLEELRLVLGEVTVDRAVTEKMQDGERPRAPGMKYRHYAPKAPVTAVTGRPACSAAYICAQLRPDEGVICFDEYAPLFSGHIVHTLGASNDPHAHARHIFEALRAFDATSVTAIYAQCPDDRGLGLAVGNRLKKAAGFHVVRAPALPVMIGITGPTGAGKTTALRALERLGGTVVDCDKLYAEMVETDALLRTSLAEAFGDVFDGGRLNREKLGCIVFSDPAALERLNNIVYARLSRELLRRVGASGAKVAGIDAVNLHESGLAALCDHTVGLLAPVETRIERIMARDGIDRERAKRRVDAQKGESFYREHCTDILVNDAAAQRSFEEKAEAFFSGMIQQIEEERRA